MENVKDFIIKKMREIVQDKHAGEPDLQETKDNFRLHILCVLNEIKEKIQSSK